MKRLTLTDTYGTSPFEFCQPDAIPKFISAEGTWQLVGANRQLLYNPNHRWWHYTTGIQ